LLGNGFVTVGKLGGIDYFVFTPTTFLEYRPILQKVGVGLSHPRHPRAGRPHRAARRYPPCAPPYEAQQPDDETRDAAATGGPDQHGDTAVQPPVNVHGLPLRGLGSGNLLLYSSGDVISAARDRLSRSGVSTGGSGDVETGSDRKFPISPTLPRIISESRSFSFFESIFLKS